MSSFCAAQSYPTAPLTILLNKIKHKIEKKQKTFDYFSDRYYNKIVKLGK